MEPSSAGARTLYLVRHADAADDALTELGRRQTALLAERFAEVRFDAVHHSTSTRAAETARGLTPALAVSPPVHATDLLCECVPSVPPVLTTAQRAFFGEFPAETLTDGARQAAGAAERFTRPTAADRRELLVTHGNLIRWLTCRALRAPNGWVNMADYNCALTVLLHRPDGTARVLTYNDTGHLPAVLRGTEYPPELRF